ncbi:hypothetical protein PG995_006492 [Apiospora arundinis]
MWEWATTQPMFEAATMASPGSWVSKVQFDGELQIHSVDPKDQAELTGRRPPAWVAGTAEPWMMQRTAAEG